MKFSSRYVLRELGGKGILMPEKVSAPSMRTESGSLRAVTLSDSALWLIKSFEGKEFSFGQAVDAVRGRYEVDCDTAEADVTALLDTLRSCGIIEE